MRSLRTKHAVILALSARAIAALLTRTYAAPDEYYQGPEPAHLLAFGRGLLTWEWAPRAALRSHAHPALLAAFAYAPVRAVEALSPALRPPRLRWAREVVLPLLWLAPRLASAAAAAAGDVAAFLLARRLFGKRSAAYALGAQLCSWFAIFAAARPLANGAEAALTAVALLLWRAALDSEQERFGARTVKAESQASSVPDLRMAQPSPKSRSALVRARRASATSGRGDPSAARHAQSIVGVSSLLGPSASSLANAAGAGLCAGLAFAVRPTSAVIWAFLALAALPQLGVRRLICLTARSALPAAAAVVALAASLDSHLYGRPTLPAFNFFVFNSLTGLDKLYGVYPALWYLYNGLPAACGLLLPLVLYSLWMLFGASEVQARVSAAAWWRARELALASAGLVIALSAASAHKEHRFLFPLISSISIYSGLALANLESRRFFAQPRCFLGLLALAASISVSAGLYINLAHQRGPVAVAEALASDAALADVRTFRTRAARGAESGSAGSPELSPRRLMQAHFLMPCHSTPFYSVVHYDVELVLLDCSPDARHVANASHAGAAWDGAGQFRAGICASAGCCGAEEMPAVCESEAWASQPEALLRALYGSTADGGLLPPAICADNAYSDANSVASPRPPLQFATAPEAFASEFGADICRERLRRSTQDWRAARRRLPSHIVLFDIDVDHPDDPLNSLLFGSEETPRPPTPILAWLLANNYSQAGAFLQSAVSIRSDVHARRRSGREPSEVRLYTHSCWQSWAERAEGEERSDPT
jgi:GPI mannosyltransferase 3